MPRALLPPRGAVTVAEVDVALVSAGERTRGVRYPAVTISDEEAEAAAAAAAARGGDDAAAAAAAASEARLIPAAVWESGATAATALGAALRDRLAPAAGQLQEKLGVTLPWPLAAPLPHAAPPPALVAWHARRQWLAVAHTPTDTVLVYDLDAAPLGGGGSVDDVAAARYALADARQRSVSALAWRPVRATGLAVGAAGGALLWALGRPLGSGGGGAAAPRAAFLKYADGGARVTALAWCPSGQRLAGSSADRAHVVVWDAARGGGGGGALMRFGLDPLPLLRWSPCGAYLFAGGGPSGRFHVAETGGWRSASWGAPPGCSVTAAAWCPQSAGGNGGNGGGALLLAFSGGAAPGPGASAVVLSFVAPPPALDEQLLPVGLPGVTAPQDGLPYSSDSGPLPPRAATIADLAWDAPGRRLAVLLRPPHPAAGCVAVYSAAPGGPAPLAGGAGLVGFARPHADAGSGEPLAALAFAPAAKGGSVLSVLGATRAGRLRVANIVLGQ